MSDLVLKSYEFRAEREETWRELESIVLRVEKKGLRSLGPDELARLPVLYRVTASSLSVARAVSLDKNVVTYLEALASRAYFCVYGTRRQLFDTLADFVVRTFPGAVRRNAWAVVVSALLTVLGVATRLLLTLQSPDRFYSFVDAEYAQGRTPGASTAELRSALYSGRRDASDQLAMFASFLFSHNARIGMLCFALGVLLGIPVVILLFTHGLLLGAFAALYQSRGLGLDFWGWVLPHGVTEIGALILCGAAGLILGQTVLAAGRHRRLDNLRIRGREAAAIVMGAVAMLLLAALIEGLFRQLVHSVPIRYAVVALTAAGWTLYFLRSGREAAR